MLSLILCIPDWPMYNRKPVTWLKAVGSTETVGAEKKSKKNKSKDSKETDEEKAVRKQKKEKIEKKEKKEKQGVSSNKTKAE